MERVLTDRRRQHASPRQAKERKMIATHPTDLKMFEINLEPTSMNLPFF
jgi:hypothetical protein